MPRKAKTLYHVEYDSAFESIPLPRHLFPLPIESQPFGTMTKTIEKLITFAEAYLLLNQDELRKSKPPPGEHRKVLDTVQDNLICSLYSDMRFYLRWMDIRGGPDDKPEYFPKGVQVLIDRSKLELERDIGFLRSCDYREFVVYEYEDSYSRCASLCDATRRGHLAEHGSALSFSRADVKKTMHRETGFVGTVDYSHVKKGLLREATDAEQ